MENREHFFGTLMGSTYRRHNKTETYVEVPPALIITDERGDVWSLGLQYVFHGQRLLYNVICNDLDMGEMAEKIVFDGRVKIYGAERWKIWNGRAFI